MNDSERSFGLNDSVIAFFFNRISWGTKISRSEHARFNHLLEKHSEFYRELCADGKAKVINRVLSFMQREKFVGEGVEVSNEMKLFISFAAVKLTFGFENFLIPHLHTIHVAKQAFYSKMIGAHAKGLTFESGKMYLSWEDVVEGIRDPDDGIHLAEHEMAHALKIDTIKGSPAKERFAFYLNTWLKHAENQSKSENRSGFLRAYAQTNMHEFFAVCLENFIERPKKFFLNEPQLFAYTCYLLNQFPLEPKNRELNGNAISVLRSKTGVEFPDRSHKDYSHHAWHWSLTFLIISLLVSPIAIGVLAAQAEIPLGGFIWWVGCSTIAWFALYKNIIGYNALDRGKYFAFTGPALYAFLLLVDAMIPVYSWNEQYKVVSMNKALNDAAVVLTLEDNALSDQLFLRKIHRYGYGLYDFEGQEIYLDVGFKRGLLGVKRYKGSRVILPD